MKAYPAVGDLLGPTLQVAMPRAAGSARSLSRSPPHVGDEESSPCLYRFTPLEAKSCPVLLLRLRRVGCTRAGHLPDC